MRVLSLAILLLCQASACTGELADTEVDVANVSGSVEFTNSAGTVEYDLGSTVTAMAHDGTTLYIGTDEGVSGLYGVELIALKVVKEIGGPETTGGTLDLAPRPEGVLVIAENGLFTSSGTSLLYSSLNDVLPQEAIVAGQVVTGSEGESVYLLTASTLLQVETAFLREITLPGADGAPTAFAANDERMLIAYGDALFELDLTDFTHWSISDGLGPIESISHKNGVFTAAIGDSLLVRAQNGTYTAYTASHQGEALSVLDTTWTSGHGPIGTTSSGLVAAEPALKGLYQWDSQAPGSHLESDSFGNLWIGRGDTVLGVMVGENVSFEEGVATILNESCAACHANPATGAPAMDFANYALVTAQSDEILSRVLAGTMPPSGPLQGDDLDTLIRWYTTGQNP